MNWSPDADEAAKLVLKLHGAELLAEAERVAKRADADTVSASYVDQAANTVRLRQPGSGAADVLLTMGTTLGGLAGGVWATAITSTDPLEPAWLSTAAILSGLVSALITGAGATLKLRSR